MMRIILIALFIVLLPTHPANAGGFTEGAPAKVLPAAIEFCRKYPQQCTRSPGGRTSVRLAEIRDFLADIHRYVRLWIHPMNPENKPELAEKPDSWDIRGPGSVDDCDAYAVTSRAELIAEGVPAGALRLTVVQLFDKFSKESYGHLVLTVVIEDGDDLILDNSFVAPVTRHDIARYYRETKEEYLWQSRQSGRNPLDFREIREAE